MRSGWRRSCIAFRPGAGAFLPLHFLHARAVAIEGEAKLESFLRWSDRPLVKLAEGVLVLLLAVHLLGGLRLLVLENLPWLDGQKRLALRGGAARWWSPSPSWRGCSKAVCA
jgi:fumarate reductase subunit D